MSKRNALLCAALLTVVTRHSIAQEPSNAELAKAPQELRFFQLHNVAQQNDANEILVALRNMIAPADKIYLVVSTNQIVMSAAASEIEKAKTIIDALDRPKPLFRLTYTLNESEGGKRIGVQHFSEVVVLGQRAVIKQGDKVPILTGSYDPGKSQQQTQFTYLDVGMNLDSTLDQLGNGLRLRSKVEQSSVAPGDQSSKSADDPIVRQTILEGTSIIIPGKPFLLGSVDIVGSTRHIDVEVLAEPVS